jgi:ketosteroid isomerase-like protein
MKLANSPITGRELNQELTSQMQALSGFYRALNERDIELMQRNWAQTSEAVMDNPVGGVMRGWDEIKGVYERIFSSPQPFRFELHEYSYHEAGDIFYVVGRERGEFHAGEMVLQMAIRTSRIFRRLDGAWRQVHHHGSIDDPKLLAAYQQAVRRNS